MIESSTTPTPVVAGTARWAVPALLGSMVDRMTQALGLVSGVLLATCALLVSADVVARYVFHSPSVWVPEISIYLVISAVFLAVGFGLKEDSHVGVRVFTNTLREESRIALEALGYVFVFAYSLVFVRFGVMMVTTSIRRQEASDFLGLPLWTVKLVFVAAFVALALQSIRMLVSRVADLAAGGVSRALSLNTLGLLGAAVAALVALVLVSVYVNLVVGLLLLMLLLLGLGIPVSFTLGLVGAFGLVRILGLSDGLSGTPQIAYWTWDSYTVMALPLFVFVGHIMFRSGLADGLFDFCRAWLGHLPGGIGVATLGACAVFAAVSGSSVANAATIGLVAIPAMEKYGYDRRTAAGLVAAGGTMGILIPPSTAMLLIGIITDQSISRLFIAGLIPGVVLFLTLSLATVVISRKRGLGSGLERVSWGGRWRATGRASGALAMPVIILGGLYSGVFTPTEAAAVAVTYALVFAVVVKRMGPRQLVELVTEATKTVAMAGILLAGAMALGKVIAFLQLPQTVASFFAGAGWHPIAVVVAAMGLILVLGMFLDGSAIALLTMPILAPLIAGLGFDLLWFSVLFTMNTEIGLITPPVGMNLFVIQQISGVEAHQVLRGSLPFVLVIALTMLLVALLPFLSTWLPATMG